MKVGEAMYYVVNGELYHHGIKGMRWGVMHGPPYPLSIGKHNSVVSGLKDGGTASKKQSSSGDNTSIFKKHFRVTPIKNDDQRNKKTKNNGKSIGLLGNHRERLVNKYREEGYSRNAAEIAAKNRLRTELVVGALSAVAIGVVAKKAYTAYGREYCDKIFKSGLEIQNIGDDADITFNDKPFYAAVNKHDKKLYKNLYAKEKQDNDLTGILFGGMRFRHPTIYENKVKLNTDVRRASNKKAREIFYKRMNSDEKFKNNVLDVLSKTNYADSSIDKYKNGGVQSKKLYDRFNQALATPEMQTSGAANDFYSDLKKNGYNAIIDINDTKYSGYKHFAKEPTIFFGEGKWNKISNEPISDSDIKFNDKKERTALMAKEFAKSYGASLAAFYGIGTLAEYRVVNNYLEKHKNTKLTGKQIVNEVNKQQRKEKNKKKEAK